MSDVGVDVIGKRGASVEVGRRLFYFLLVFIFHVIIILFLVV